MPSKRVRNGKVRWIGQINRTGLRKEKAFKSKTAAGKWETEVKELLESSIPVEDISRLLNLGHAPLAIPEIWNREQTHTVSLLEWAEGYLDHAQMMLSHDEYLARRSVLRRLLTWLGDPSAPVEALSVSQAYDYLHRQAKDRTNNAANKDRTHLMTAWNWGIKYEKCSNPNPFQKVDKLPHDKKHHYMPPWEDFFKVVEIADGQDKVLLLTYLHTAGRRQELLNLKWEDVDFNRKRIRLYTRKRRGGNLEADWIDMNGELLGLLKEHKTHSVNKWVFINLQKGRTYLKPFRTGRKKFPKNLCRKAGVKPFGCHGIRALTATTLAQNDIPMMAIKQHLRHKNLSVTEDYVRGMVSIRPHLKVLEGGIRPKKAVA